MLKRFAARIQVGIFKLLCFPSAMVVFKSMLQLDTHLEFIKKNSHSPYMEASSSLPDQAD